MSQQGTEARDWLQGFGYVKLWEQLHRAEEILLLFAPLQTLITDAWRDELRLQGSNIDNRDALLTRLHDAITVLTERYQQIYSKSPAPGGSPVVMRTFVEEFMARETLRYVRQTINEFRDERRTGLIRARNRLLRTVTLTGFVAFAVVMLAVLVGAPPKSLIAAATFYLIGAIVGLFNQLSMDASAETATEDYGLAMARLLHTPLFSGLAALGGVFIIPMLSVLINPSGARTASLGVEQQLSVPNLIEIFDLGNRPFGLVLAAIFGLSPTVLIQRLQQEAEQYKADLRSSASPTRR